MNNVHEMRLNNEPFNKIKEGSKIVELRLYDEKRQKLKENDLICFTNIETKEKITALIEKLCIYKSFYELYKDFNKIEMGYNEEDEANPKDMEKYYSVEEQEKYGVVGIKLKLVKN